MPLTPRWTLACLAAISSASGACHSLDELWARSQGSSSSDASPAVAQSGDEDPSPDASTPARPSHRDASAEARVERRDAGATETAVLGDANAAADAADAAAVAYTGPRLRADWVWVPVRERPEPQATLLGYLRSGAAVPVEANSVGTEGCPRGWYAVRGGGFVCNSRMTTVLTGNETEAQLNRVPTASQPDHHASMPYPYMIAYRASPVYRWAPSAEDMREVEPERFGDRTSSNNSNTPDAAAAPLAPAGALGALLSTAAPGADAAAAVARVTDRHEAADAGVRIEQLQGEEGTPLLRRMLTGMYISVDREVRAGGRRFWRTQSGGFVEQGAVSPVRNAPTFQGIALDAQHTLPMAFMAAFEGYTYDVDPARRTATRRERAPRLTAYSLTEEPPVTVGRAQYVHTREGLWLNSRQLRTVAPHAPPADLGATEKWIEVNLDRQMLMAYEGSRLVYVTLVSTGRTNREDATRNYETVQGGFRIVSKHVATTMDGNSAGDGPYSIEDVPWVMYFEGSFALHGAFWHNNFGFVRSHGCVNMAPADAHWVFNWTEPQLPQGWHGVYASSGRPGTRVYVHYENQTLGTRGGPERPPQH